MRRYHHIGIPTTESKPEETYLKDLKLFVVSHQKSEFGVEWMRFEADAAVPDLVRRVPHVPFEVTDLSSELALREILIPRNSPSKGSASRSSSKMARPSNCSNSPTPNTQPVYRTKWTSNVRFGSHRIKFSVFCLPTIRELVDSVSASAILRTPSGVVRNIRVREARPEGRSRIEPF